MSTTSDSPRPAVGVEKPLLLFFHSPLSGRSRKAEAYLANVLQRCANHETFALRRIDASRHEALARRFHVEEVPVLMVVDGNRVAARLDSPNGIRPIAAALRPWLKRHDDTR